MTLPYTLVAYVLGPEFPSLLGSLAGLSFMVWCVRRGWFMPPGSSVWTFGPPAHWDSDWLGEKGGILESAPSSRPMSLWRAWFPYLLVAGLLVLTRLKFLPLVSWLRSVKLEWQHILGSELGVAIEPLYLPGTLFIVTSVATFWLHRMSAKNYRRAVKTSAGTMAKASVALVFTVPMVQVFLNTADGAAGLLKMPNALALGVASSVGSAWPFFAPLIGGFGAFVAGSNTVSNMTFSLFQFGVGEQIGLDPLWVVALQAVGGAAGNIICVHNVVAASAVVGCLGKEGQIIRRTAVIFLYYAFFAGALGYALLWLPQRGVLNLGAWIVLGMGTAIVLWVRHHLGRR